MPQRRSLFAFSIAAPTLLAGLLLGAASPSYGIIITGSGTNGDGRNLTDAPNGVGSYEGNFGGYLGTPIAPRYFVTANHVSGAANSLVYNDGSSTAHTYGATFVANQGDLAVWKINDGEPAFTHYAPIYRGSNEVGKNAVVVGRGVARGAAITSPTSGNQAGWGWGGSDGAVSWGNSVVDSVTSATVPGFSGDMLRFGFRNDGGVHDAFMAAGDSGGAMFVQDSDGAWKLAGINGYSENTFSTTANGATFNAALYDARGFYSGDQLISGSSPVYASSYATRISADATFLDGITGPVISGVPEPASLALLACGASALLLRRRVRA